MIMIVHWIKQHNICHTYSFLPIRRKEREREGKKRRGRERKRERERERERGCSLVGISTNYQSFIYSTLVDRMVSF